MQQQSKLWNPSGSIGNFVSRGLSSLFFWLVKAFPNARRLGYGLMFAAIAAITGRHSSVTFMNYGYADLDDSAGAIERDPAVEPERYCQQLYQRVAGAVDLTGANVLEVSCGRGGGAAYILRHLGARHVTGLDRCRRSVEFCRWFHKDSSLTFLHGDAESLPFAPETFDAVVNVEASFCYVDMDRFLAEVRRVLKPGGHFAFADLRDADEVGDLRRILDASGLEVVEGADITANVTRALGLDSDRRLSAIRRSVSRPLRGLYGTYAGVKGSRIPKLFERRALVYLCFLLRKP